MKLVMFWIASDDCSYSFDVSMPLEYDSVEQATKDFQTAMANALTNNRSKFKFACQEFYPSDFSNDNFPKFYTLEDWFEEFRIDRL